MKRLNHIFLITLVALLFACNSNTDKKENTEIVKTHIAEQNNRIEPEPEEKEPNQDFNCVRGQAEPIVIKEIYPNTTFTVQPDSLTAIETIELDNGEKVIIKNWGCEYYVLSFQFETSKYNADITAMKYWYIISYKLMNEIKKGIDAPIDIEKGLQAFNDYISKNVFDLDLDLETEIYYGENEIRNFVSLDNISKIENNRFSVTISFAVGPL
jgi:hypothetical protein